MTGFLERIVAHKRVELRKMKQAEPADVLHREVERMLEEQGKAVSVSAALKASETGIIAEFKRKSPSRGWINVKARPATITMGYQNAGATAVSILTDQMFFGGSDSHINQARSAGLKVPVLYKNFVIDEYQLFQARRCGASAVLLIAACLSRQECRTLLETARGIGLEVLLEMHGADELEYASLEPDICGINNRNLETFETDVTTSFELAGKLPANICRISESGIEKVETIASLRKAGFNGFLIGSRFMGTPMPDKALNTFIRDLKKLL